MKSKPKSLIKDIFGSLFNNDKAIAAAKNNPLWITLIIFFLAIIIPIVPITVGYANSKGADVVKINSYGLEKTLPYVALKMEGNNEKLILNENKKLNFTTNDAIPVYTYTNEVTTYPELEVFFSAAESNDAKKAFIKEVSAYKHEIQPADTDAGVETKYVKASFVIYFNDIYSMQLYLPGTDSAIQGAGYAGDYKSFKAGDDLLKVLTTVEGAEIKCSTDAEIKETLSNATTAKAIYNNYKQFLNKTYGTTKKNSILYGSLIFLGIYTGLSLIMAFVMWLLTRGKNNPFNYISILTMFKIESWASLCPALIGVLLGFIMPGDITMKMLLFIAPLGLRAMFMMTKQFRPM